MPRIIAHYSKKLPTGNYSNHEFAASIEANVESDNASTVNEGLRRLFARAIEAVEEQFQDAQCRSGHVAAPVVPGASAAGRPPAGQRTAPPAGNGAAATNGRPVPATECQKKAVFAICKSLGLDPAQYRIDGLTIKQASSLIDELKGQQAGN